MSKTIIQLSVFLIFISCTTPPDKAAIQEELRSNWDAFIANWEEEKAAECASFYLEDGINIPPELEVKKGRKEIEEFYNFLFSLHQKSDYTHEILDLEVSGNNAIELGQFKVDWTRNDSTEYTYHARTLTHWNLNDEGEWKVAKFIFNNPPEEEE